MHKNYPFPSLVEQSRVAALSQRLAVSQPTQAHLAEALVQEVA